MRAKISYISIFALFSAVFCSGAVAGARLPVVNIGSGVSARAAFGESVDTEIFETQRNVQIESVDKPVVAIRGVAKASGDVLVPNRPVNDIWARSVSNDLDVPVKSVAVRKPPKLPEVEIVPEIQEVESPKELAVVQRKNPDLDNQISKMVEARRAKIGNISSFDTPKIIAAVKSEPETENVSVARVVIPMDDLTTTDLPSPSVVNSDEKIAVADLDSEKNSFAKLSPMELKKAFHKTYVSENKHLSTYKIADSFDVASNVDTKTQGFDSSRDLSESGDSVRTLEIKIGFRGQDSALSRDNYTLLAEYATLVAGNPKRAIQVSIPEQFTRSFDDRKLAARRLAIVEQVLKDTGVADQRIVPVLSQREDENFVLRVISNDQYQTMTQQRKDMFGDSVGGKTYKSMTW